MPVPAAAQAGARQLLILNDGFGKLDAWADLAGAAPLPVASLGTDDSTRLLSRISKPGQATLTVVSHPHPRYLYDLLQHHEGAVPRDPSYRPDTGELARIDESFRDTRQSEAREVRADLAVGSDVALAALSTPVPAQGSLTSWVTADPGARWAAQTSVADLGERGAVRSYAPRSVTAETWLSPLHHPRMLNDGAHQAPFRTGDIISTSTMAAWGDSGGHAGVVWADGDTSKISLYQGDELLGEDANERIVTVEGLSPQPRPYRLVVAGERDLPGRPYSTRTRTEWGFTSGTTDCTTLAPLPLIQLDYAAATDLSGRAHRRTELTVTASHLKGATGAAPVRTVAVDVSYDDGTTWHPAPLHGTDGSRRALLDAPSGARYASLRTTARDTAGNTVSQTLIRAFGLQ
ncbi:hypothetical protein ACFC09_14785 [Streptomyces sp. NPDC056161]|uniref:hypothetical protein n=1 Tax=Streptomyces sp. NPDC056161 TaxID=3345732 RepID=UPI0035E036CA